MNTKHNDFRSKHFDLSEEAKFRFDILNYKTDGMIFLSTVLIIPFILSIMVSFIQPGEQGKINFQILYLVSVCVGLIFNCIRNKNGLFKGGYLWIYIFILAPQVIGVLISSITLAIFELTEENKGVVNSFVSVVTMIVTEIIIIALVLKFDRKIFKRIIETFKTKWKELLVVSIFGLILLSIIVTIIINWLIETLWFGLGESSNQEALKSILNGDYGKTIRIAYIIPLFILTVVTAPLAEEICMRNSFNLNASNRWLGFVGSAMFFGFIHYGPAFDFEHILSYSAAGFILSGIFLYTKGNMTYSWTIHLLNNLLAFILIIAIN
ncbi:CPBP family intramembrane glutamic endopeptidase [Spiroplasma monobiae]|uniref:CAAX amino terminal membrane bound protease n=1 Tax=Spiroplasma monobiae MQ-1 TaxID=1336748 RepID=A0A2K9LU00_SPISQ|nr:type II CAAX endopeptidase family protein [Spiroplasma monobiae]AUM62361.1 CAAX amino terminal membrane bound protease [Spiroplasma monobiae MQ-1]